MAVFPNGSDALPTNITPNTPESGIHADLHNKTSDAVNAVEAALLPGGSIDVSIAGKAPAVHTHVEGDVTNLTTDLAGKALTVHTHTEANVTNLTTDLAAKAAAVHTHVEGDVTALTTDLAGKAPTVHTHAEADVTALTTDLAATEKTANKGVANGYAGLDSGVLVPVARLGTGTADATTFLRGDRSFQKLPVRLFVATRENSAGLATGSWIIARIPASLAGSVVKMQAYIVGTSGTLLWNWRKNGTLTFHSGDITSGVNVWVASTTIQNAALVADDYIELIISSVSSATITYIETQLEVQT